MTAQRILKKKTFIKAEMDRRLEKTQSDALWQKAAERLEGILQQYADLPKGVRAHTDTYIFPSAAIYSTLKEAVGAETAYDIVETAAIDLTNNYGKKIAGMMKLPGMPALFVKVFDPISRYHFGPKNGFQNVFYPKEKGVYRMDILACPYARYFQELGCFELTKIFCENDDRVYGNLPGLQFERHTTIGKGGEKCDFCIKRV